MTTRHARLRQLTLPSLVVAGSLGILELLRGHFQQRQLFLPDRFPNGIWEPEPFGLDTEDRWFCAEDGITLHGWWMRHRRARGTLLYCHGNSGSLGHQVGVLRFLRRLRLNVFAFDYRGYGRSVGSPSEKGLFRDVRAAYRHLVEDLAIAPAEILLFGHSLGGAVAIDAARELPVAGLVVQSSFTQVRDMARVAFPGLPLHWVARNQFCSIDKVAEIAVPKLFIHGAEDGTVPVEMGRRLFAAASDPKELYVVARAGHNDVYRFGGWSYLRRLARFQRACRRGEPVAG